MQEREASAGLESCPVGPFEEARRPQHREARSVPCGRRREAQETTQSKAASPKVKGAAEKGQHDAPFKCVAGSWGTETSSQARTVLSPSFSAVGPRAVSSS